MATRPMKTITGLPGQEENTYTFLQLDNTLAVAGKAADAQKTGQEIADLKSALSDTTGVSEIAFRSGYYISTGVATGSTVDLTEIANASWRCAVVNCKKGDGFILNAKGGVSPRAYCFIDSDNKCLAVSGASYTATDYFMIAPDNSAKLIINDNSTTQPVSYYKPIKAVYNSIDALSNSLDNSIDYVKTIKDGFLFPVATSGNVYIKYSIKSGHTYTIVNQTDKAIAASTVTSDVAGSTVETISGNIASGASVSYTAGSNAPYIRIYIASTPTGSVYLQDDNSDLPKLEAKVDDLDIKANDAVNLIKNGYKNTSSKWEQGLYWPNGVPGSSSKAIRTDFLDNIAYIYTDQDHYIAVYAWDTSDGTCKGILGRSASGEWFFGDTTYKNIYELDLDAFKTLFPTYHYKVVLYRQDNADIDTSESGFVTFVDYVRRNWQDVRHPMLTFVDDDGRSESGESWEEINASVNVPATFALVTARMGTSGGWMTWDDVERLQNIGFEFISHTHNHINLGDSTLTEQEVVADFEATIAALKQHGCQSGYVAYPYAFITEDNEELVQKYFKLGLHLMTNYNIRYVPRTMVKRILITKGNIEQQTIDGQQLYVYSYRTLSEMKAIIDKTITDNAWTIICTHLRNSATNNDQTSDGFYYNDDVKQLVVDTVKYARAKGVEIVTVADAYSKCRDIFT